MLKKNNDYANAQQYTDAMLNASNEQLGDLMVQFSSKQ